MVGLGDKVFRENAELLGRANWSQIAEALPECNGKQCRDRWKKRMIG
jgi:hypothetical protein